MKRFSCPFDWIFSNASMVTDCIETNFAKFLDKTQYISLNETQCTHKLYDIVDPTFNHHNPSNDQDYEYFKRCVNRFNECLASGENTLFIQTVVSNNNNYITSYTDERKLFQFLSRKSAGDFVFCVIVITDKMLDKPRFTLEDEKTHGRNKLLVYSFDRTSDCTGVDFVDKLDRDMFSNLLLHVQNNMNNKFKGV
jgi:hypothetical protein